MKSKILIATATSLLLSTAPAFAENTVSILTTGYIQPIEGRGFLPGAQDDGARKVASTVSLVQGDNNFVLIADPGMAAPGIWDGILAELSGRGLAPEDVTHIFISHHHPDHTTQLGLFPNASLVDFWATYKDDIWSDHPNNYDIAPGVTVVRTPGHTDEDASLMVDTAEGIYALTHLWWTPGYEPKEDPLAEDAHGIEHSRKIVSAQADWIVPGHGALFHHDRANREDVSAEDEAKVLAAVKAASDNWIASFNSGDAAGAASAYEDDAVMTALPFGRFVGKPATEEFWVDIISKGLSDVKYIEPKIEVISDQAAIISSKWSMNAAHGLITKELWVLQDDGTAKLRIDNFEIQG